MSNVGTYSALCVDAISKAFVVGVRGCSAVVRALDDVSLGVAEGETIVLAGPAGAGKTTLLLCAAGLMIPDRGRVLVAGEHNVADARTCYVAKRARSAATVMSAARREGTRLLLLDGVIDDLDACARRELLSVIADHHCAAVIATRDVELARRLAVRVVEMAAGRIRPRRESIAPAARVAELQRL